MSATKNRRTSNSPTRPLGVRRRGWEGAREDKLELDAVAVKDKPLIERKCGGVEDLLLLFELHPPQPLDAVLVTELIQRRRVQVGVLDADNKHSTFAADRTFLRVTNHIDYLSCGVSVAERRCKLISSRSSTPPALRSALRGSTSVALRRPKSRTSFGHSMWLGYTAE